LSVGLFPTDPTARFGSLNLYSRTPGGLADANHDIAVMFAAHTAAEIRRVSSLEASVERAHHLAQALDSRDVIGQAKGILMHTRHIDAGAAFDLLAAASQRRNLKLRDLAARVVAGELADSDDVLRGRRG
jgi:GAF domain-containing protein